ncbi:hypothetical protein [Desemzia sp. FAM 24101]|uniref:hypothetical protein n=1 Tax=unclassified Desemzia TaxID=2685243 RepID=UPI003888FE27
MTNEEILALGEEEFKTYIRIERNKAIDKTLKIQMDGLKKKKNDLEKSAATLNHEANDALDTANIEIAITKDNEIKASENEISALDKAMERLLENNEELVIIDRERFDELKKLVEAYYARKINTTKKEFNEKIKSIIPVKNEGDRLLKERASLLTGFTSISGQGNVFSNQMLSVDKSNALSILLSK